MNAFTGIERKTYRRALSLGLVLALGLTACTQPDLQSPPPPSVCENDCTLTVTLPSDPMAPPKVSDSIFMAASGASVQIKLVDELGDRSRAATVLEFESAYDSPFLNPGGQAMQTVPLTPGKNAFTVRSDENGCLNTQNYAGCKYTVRNRGNSKRYLLDPHVILW